METSIDYNTDTLTDWNGNKWVRIDNVEKVQVHTLHPAVAAQARKKFPVIAVTNETSPMQAGYQLGVHAVFDELVRLGFIVEK